MRHKVVATVLGRQLGIIALATTRWAASAPPGLKCHPAVFETLPTYVIILWGIHLCNQNHTRVNLDIFPLDYFFSHTYRTRPCGMGIVTIYVRLQIYNVRDQCACLCFKRCSRYASCPHSGLASPISLRRRAKLTMGFLEAFNQSRYGTHQRWNCFFNPQNNLLQLTLFIYIMYSSL